MQRSGSGQRAIVDVVGSDTPATVDQLKLRALQCDNNLDPLTALCAALRDITASGKKKAKVMVFFNTRSEAIVFCNALDVSDASGKDEKKLGKPLSVSQIRSIVG